MIVNVSFWLPLLRWLNKWICIVLCSPNLNDMLWGCRIDFKCVSNLLQFGKLLVVSLLYVHANANILHKCLFVTWNLHLIRCVEEVENMLVRIDPLLQFLLLSLYSVPTLSILFYCPPPHHPWHIPPLKHSTLTKIMFTTFNVNS